MSQAVSKALQFMDKKDLECSICLSRFHQPKTLKCMHTYCLQCIQKWVETHGKMKCPTCGQEHNLTRYDLKELTSNTMIIQLLEYVRKTEDQKPSKCTCCDINQPEYHCQTCQLYLCGAPCIKQHKRVPSTKDHPLYTLDKKEQEGSSDEQNKCKVHCKNSLEFYCSTCNKSACKQCEHILYCHKKQHKMIPMSTAVIEFNSDANEVVKVAHEIKNKLTKKLEFITRNKSEIDSQINLCRTAIGIQEQKLMEKVAEKSKELMSDVEEIYKEEKEDIDSILQDIDSKMTQVNNLLASINTIMNKPEEKEVLESQQKNLKAVRDTVHRTDFYRPVQKSKKKRITPRFIPSTRLDELINTEGIGKIITADNAYKVDNDDEAGISNITVGSTYKVAKDDQVITVTKGQPFVVKVTSKAVSDTSRLGATLRKASGEELATEIKYQGNGEYKITGRCNVEGDWQMKITFGVTQINGSPVNIKVESLGLVHTIGNIPKYKEHSKKAKVSGVILDTDGCILVSSYSKDILKFNQSGVYVAKRQVRQNVHVNEMHQIGDGHMVYSDDLGHCVVMCDDKFQEIRSFGKGILECPNGLTVNRETSILYVVDRGAHCVFKFNVDDGRLLGKFGSEGSKFGQMNDPSDVTLTKEGYVIVADCDNNRIQMFNEKEKFKEILIGCGKKDGKVWGPCGVTIDMDENIIISSNHKLQLFDKNGVFIKRIDHEDDGLDIPCGITVISNRPRRVAVANHEANNIKIFNY
ncbi:tripartite motif-containing protein 2-like [Anneissia japonica]|uniref:tripartite motif-containing protein 2-like n=1 Tax=Anneissia japonica TaxID=1529436 RepID=UPI001425965A|nr:tripartite motif-containing protein 2-like [Anneissia japonica]XP_033119040.1 tripartite motif-containing protein 2-like [Anneissia japonica]